MSLAVDRKVAAPTQNQALAADGVLAAGPLRSWLDRARIDDGDPREQA